MPKIDIDFHVNLINMYRRTLKAFQHIESIILNADTEEKKLASRKELKKFRAMMWTDGELNEI